MAKRAHVNVAFPPTRPVNNSHLHALTGVLRQDQVNAAMAALMTQLRNSFPTDPDYSKAVFEVNVIAKKDGTLTGITYIWVSEPKVYNILIGCEPDGSKRVELVDDPNWVPQKRAEISTVGLDWATISELEAVEDAKETCPKLERKLPPIATIPLVTYNRDQFIAVSRELRKGGTHPALTIELKALDAIFDRHSRKPLTLEATAALAAYDKAKEQHPDILTDLHFFGGVIINRSYVLLPSEDKDPRTIRCGLAPHWVTETMMRTYFDCFSTDKRLYRAVNKMYKYPRIRVVPQPRKLDVKGRPMNMVFVEYSPGADHITDATFALQMRTRFRVEGPPGEESAWLIFSHWEHSPPKGRK